MKNPLGDIRSHAELLARAERAQADDDVRTAMRAAKVLQRRGHFSDAWRIFSELRRDDWAQPEIGPEWTGQPLAGATLLVSDRGRNIVPRMRMARFLGIAAEQAARVTAFTDPRLVETLSRTFPDVEIRGDDDDRTLPPVDFVASYDRLGQHLVDDGRTQNFPPLLPDPEKVEAFRPTENGGKPRIGIAWHSTNAAKDLPALQDWIDFMNATDADFVSLQYHEREFGFDELAEGVGGKLTRIEGVDHFHDMEGHFAAIAGTDLLVTISNTTAHAAGCLDHPLLVLLDEGKGSMHWSDTGEVDHFFPSARLVRKGERDWPDVFADVARRLAQSGSA